MRTGRGSLIVITLLLGVLCSCGRSNRPAGGNITRDNLTVSRQALGDRLNLFAFEEYLDDALLRRFETEYGVRVQVDVYPTNEAMMAKLDAGALDQYDLVIASEFAVEKMTAGGMLARVDKSLMPNFRNLMPEFVNLPFDPSNQHSIPYLWGITGLAVRADKIPSWSASRRTWGLLLNPAEAAGPFVLLDDRREALGAALIYKNRDVNTTQAEDMRQAEQLLRDARRRALAIASGSTARDYLLSGDAFVVQGYSGDLLLARRSNPAIEFFVPAEGALSFLDSFAIPARAAHPVAAQVFINYMLGGANGAQSANRLGFGTPNAAAVPQLQPDLATEYRRYLGPEWKNRIHPVRFLGVNEALYDQAWSRVKAGQ